MTSRSQASSPDVRIATLDVLRGVAVMGILVANLPAFALPVSAYFSPLAAGGTAPADIAAWLVTFVLIEGKMRGLFSMVFGASMLLVIQRAEAKGESGAAVHFNRMAWLFVIGCMHLYLLWWGDILAHYALVGAIAFCFVGLRVRWLVGIAAVLIAWQTVSGIGVYFAVADAAAHPTPGGRALIGAMEQAFGRPPAATIAREITAYRSGWGSGIAQRWREAASPLTFLPIIGPDTLAAMLIGMAGLKSGFLRGAWPRALYARWAAVTLGIALPLYAILGWRTIIGGFALGDVILGAIVISPSLRAMAFTGYAALIILIAHRDGWLIDRIAAAGRAAFTNYLGTTIAMTAIFYGFGWFGHLSRASLYGLVPIAWTVMLAWSRPWLATHRYGPLEWMWRILARRQWQTMRIRQNATN